MIDTKALREKVLDLAIRGKLVPQDPNDEPATVLLERIREQKKQMVKEGKLKAKDIKNDTVIFKGDDNLHYEQFADGSVKCIEDEIPFELPEGWAWCRFKSFCYPISDGTHQTPTYTKNGHTFLSAKNVTSWKIDWDNVRYIPEELHIELSKRIKPQKGDILLAKNGTIGVAAIVDKEFDFDIYVTLALIRTVSNSINSQYLLNTMASSTVQSEFRSTLIGIGVQNLHLEHIREVLIPIAPHNEQERITDKVLSLLPLLETIETNKTNLYSLIETTKSKILDLAIRGQLVPQDPNDEPASVLLERIRAEKEELIKAGKIKRDKKESVIFKGDDNSYYRSGGKCTEKCEDLPFDLPKGWQWTSLGQCCEKVTDQVASGSFAALRENVLSLKEPNYAIMVKTADFSNNFTKNLTYTDKHGYEFLENSNLFGGELILSNIGSIGKVFIVPDLKTKMTLAPNSVMIRLTNNKCKDYLYYFLLSPTGYTELKAISTGVAMLKFNKTDLKTIYFPLPPLAEQKRIVKAIETIFATLDDIATQVA